MSTALPLTSPPPKTLSSSGRCVDMRGSESMPRAAMGRGAESVERDSPARAAGGASLCSTKELHAPHSVHLPSHLWELCPHDWHA